MKPILIGLCGALGAGKDTAIHAIKTFDSTAVRLAFADPIYEACYILNPIIRYRWFFRVRLQTLVDNEGWEVVKRKYPEARRLLQYFGTDVGRKLWGENFWVDQMFAKWNPLIPTLVSGVRFDTEISSIKDRGGELWYVERPGLVRGKEHKHKSEHALTVSECDRVFVNHRVDTFQHDIAAAYYKYAKKCRNPSYPEECQSDDQESKNP